MVLGAVRTDSNTGATYREQCEQCHQGAHDEHNCLWKRFERSFDPERYHISRPRLCILKWFTCMAFHDGCRYESVAMPLRLKKPPSFTTHVKLDGCQSRSKTRPDYKAVATPSKVVLVVVPTDVIAVRQTTMINANMTAYSTAVGPSSDTKNFLTLLSICMFFSLSVRDQPMRQRFPKALRKPQAA